MKKTVVLFLTFLCLFSAHADEDTNLIQDVIKKFSLQAGLQGYIQNIYQKDYEDRVEETYFYQVYLQGQTPGGIKIRYKHLDAHYRYWRYFSDENTKTQDKIYLSLNKEINNNNLDIQLGYIDNFKFAQGLTFDTYYHYGISADWKSDIYSASATYFMSSLHLSDFVMTRFCLLDIIGLSYMSLQTVDDEFQYLPGLDMQLPIDKSHMHLYGEIRGGFVSESSYYYKKDSDFNEKLAWLYGMRVNLKKNDNNYIQLDFSRRKYGRMFNRILAGSDFYLFQNRLPEVMHTRYNNWLHYLEYDLSDVTGTSCSLAFKKILYKALALYGDFEYTKMDWKDYRKTKELTYYDVRLTYQYDPQVMLSLGVTNRLINVYDSYGYTPLFSDGDYTCTRLRIDFGF